MSSTANSIKEQRQEEKKDAKNEKKAILSDEDLNVLDKSCSTCLEKLKKTVDDIKKNIHIDAKNLCSLNRQNLNKTLKVIPNLKKSTTEWIKLCYLASKLAKCASNNSKDEKNIKIYEEAIQYGIDILRYLIYAKRFLQIFCDKSIITDELDSEIDNLKRYIDTFQEDPSLRTLFSTLGIKELLSERDAAEHQKAVITIENLSPAKLKMPANEPPRVVQSGASLNDDVAWFDNLADFVDKQHQPTQPNSNQDAGTPNSDAKRVSTISQAEDSLKSLNESVQQSNAAKPSPSNIFNVEHASDLQSTLEISKEIRISIKQSLLVGQLSNQDISALYDKAAESKKSTMNCLEIFDPKDTQANERTENWAYKQLIQSEALSKFISTMVKRMRKDVEDFISRSQTVHHFEWCIMVDNSGSMAPKKNHLSETLVVVIEILRRLEHKFAIARFGSKFDQNCLLKGLDLPMSMSLGQTILESFSFDQGTYSLDGLHNVTHKVWGNRNKPEHHHRIVLMITDGLTTQKNTNEWIRIIEDKKLKLGILIIKEEKHSYPRQFLEIVTTDRKCFKVINSNETDKLSFEFVQVISQIFSSITSTLTSNDNKATKAQDALVEIQIPSLGDTLKVAEFELIKKSNNVTYERASNDGNYKPNLMYTMGQSSIDTTASGRANERESDFSDKISAIEKYYKELDAKVDTNVLEELDKIWIECEQKCSQQIEDCAEVLQTVVLPCNKFTRRRADLKGANLHLPGLIKAVISDFDYKKIFSSKSTGGKREHTILFAIDISNSMSGHLAESTLNVFISVLFALQRIKRA